MPDTETIAAIRKQIRRHEQELEKYKHPPSDAYRPENPQDHLDYHEGRLDVLKLELAAAIAESNKPATKPESPTLTTTWSCGDLVRPDTATGFELTDVELYGGMSCIQLEQGGTDAIIRNVEASGHCKYAIAATNPVDGLTIDACDLGPGLPYDEPAEKAKLKPEAEATVRLYGDNLRLINCVIRGIHPLKAPVRIGAGIGKFIAKLRVMARMASVHHSCVALYPHTNPSSADPAERIEHATLLDLDLDAPLSIGPNVSDVYVHNLKVPAHLPWAVILQGPDKHNDLSKFKTHQPPRRINLPESCRGRVLATEGADLGEVSYH